MTTKPSLKKLVIKLNSIGAVKFGEFTLKSGIVAPFYIDLRLLVSYPRVMKQVAKAYSGVLRKLKYDRLGAVPYTALPIVAAVSLLNNEPWIYTRKEIKDYGTKKQIEGEYKKGERIVLIDDVVTNGASKFEAIGPMMSEGLAVKDIVILVDREQGGKEELERKGYRLHSITSISKIIGILLGEGKIGKGEYQKVKEFLESSRSSKP